jgi:hypothetical protein
MSDAHPKSLMQWIVESIDEELRERTGLDGRRIYLRGFERYETAAFESAMRRKRLELESDLPLLAEEEWTRW